MCVCFRKEGGGGGGVRQHLVQSCKVHACVLFVCMKMKSNEMEEIHEGKKFNSVISDIFYPRCKTSPIQTSFCTLCSASQRK